MGKRIGAGFDRIEYGTVDVSTGLLMGNTATGATAGAAAESAMLRLRGAQTIPVEIPEPERVVPLGDNEPRTSFSFPGAELPGGLLEMSDADTTFNALIQGTKVRTEGNYSFGALSPSGNAPQQMCLNLMRQTKKQDAGEVGITGWEGVFVTRCTIVPLFTTITQRAHTPYRYQVNIDPSDRALIGYTFTEGIDGTTQMALQEWDGDYPPHLGAFKGNASATAFTLAYTPVNATGVVVTVNGVRQTYTTHYTVSGNTLTMLSAPATGLFVNVLYEVLASDLS